jgi:pimeloyl-ACP methyl ester carboxylesterase
MMTTRTIHRLRTRRSALRAVGLLASALSTLAFPAWRSAAQPPTLEHGFAEGDGIRLHYVRAGNGPLILFLHGHPRSWQLWRAQLGEFGRDHLAVAPDLRGYGGSGQPDAVEAYAMPRLLRDLQGLLDHLGRERCILVGHDWGGYLAWVFAAAFPSRVERLVIVNGPHPMVFLREVATNPRQIAASQYERAYHAPGAFCEGGCKMYLADPIKVPASLEGGRDLLTLDLAARLLAGVAIEPATPSLAVRVPTLVIWGMQDPALLPGLLDGLDDHVAELTILRVADAGHWVVEEQPELVSQAIRRFIHR